MGDLDQAIYRTLRYFALFQQPLTPVQIWRHLILSPDTPTRWSGHRVYRLHDITRALTTSPFLTSKTSAQWGFYTTAENHDSIKQYLARHREAQMKWKLTGTLTRVLAAAPCVEGIAMSGSLAAGNTSYSSDLDLFVIAAPGRIWTARLILSLLSHLTGRRRRYWHEEAPDKLCLNHYVTSDELAMPRAVRNLYAAILYQNLRPLTGHHVFTKFHQTNATWIKRFLMFPASLPLPMRHIVEPWPLLNVCRRIIDTALREPIFNWLEHSAEKIQRRSIAKHTKAGQPGRIALSSTELAFHPDTKVPAILAAFAREDGQQSLL